MVSSIALACVLFTSGHGQSDWKRYQLEEGVVAAFPKVPEKDVVNLATGEMRRYSAQFGAGLYRVAVYMDSSSEAREMSNQVATDPGGPAVRQWMKNMIAGCNSQLKGKISDVQFGGFKGSPMERCRIDTPHIVVYVASICSKKRILCLLVAQPRGKEDLGRIQKFFDSVEL